MSELIGDLFGSDLNRQTTLFSLATIGVVWWLLVTKPKTRGRRRGIQWWEVRKRKHCPHLVLHGVYGDEANHTPGNRRLWCEDCRTFLDGPVSLATERVSRRSDVPN